MNRGAILEAAKRDGRSGVVLMAAVVAVCSLVLGLNWKYVYNFVIGPFPFSAELALTPGAREFVRATGSLVPTGIVEERTVSLLRGAAESKSVSAQFLGMMVADKLLLVKVEPGFSGTVVEGRLVPLPAVISGTLGSTPVHPWLVEADLGYRWRFNIFVMVAGPLFVLCVPLLGIALWQATSVERHSVIGQLKRFGSPLQVVRKIEDEVIAAGQVSRAGPLWITQSWVVGLTPSLRICAMKDLMGIGHKVKAQKADDKAPPQHQLALWERGAPFGSTLDVSEQEGRAVLARLAVVCRPLVVTDVAAFERRWNQEQAALEKEIDSQLSRG